MGLVESIEQDVALTLGAFLEEYIDFREDVSESTKTNYKQVMRNLNEYFGVDRFISSITAGDAEQFKTWMISKRGLAIGTVNRHVKRAKQFFAWAERKEYIGKSPFKDPRGGLSKNTDRQHFVDHETIYKVIHACPNLEWRVIIALARFGGLRVPSEITPLRWSDILWGLRSGSHYIAQDIASGQA